MNLKNLLVLAVVILALTVIYRFSPEINNALLERKYSQVNQTNTNADCYSGWVSDDFTETFSATTGFTFRYPRDLKLRKEYRRNVDIDDSVQIIEGYLNGYNMYIGITVNQNANYFLPASPEIRKSIPCNLISKANYRSARVSSLIGTPLYFTHAEILFPPNESNYKYIDFECSDHNENKTCALILPQILSTLQFKN